MKTKPNFSVNKLSRAVALAMSAAAMLTAFPGYSADENNNDPKEDFPIEPIEVIEVTGRLRSAASAAIEERREAPTVADLMGAEQISRTGDSDAAGSASSCDRFDFKRWKVHLWFAV